MMGIHDRRKTAHCAEHFLYFSVVEFILVKKQFINEVNVTWTDLQIKSMSYVK